MFAALPGALAFDYSNKFDMLLVLHERYAFSFNFGSDIPQLSLEIFNISENSLILLKSDIII